MWKAIASNFLTIFILVLLGVGSLIGWGKAKYRMQGPLQAPICVQVPQGGSMGFVSRDLEAKGAVSNAQIFRIGADYSGMSQKLKAGSFLVPAGASMEEIVDIVTRGGANTCGTEVVFRIGVTSIRAVVRELDPQTNKFMTTANFDLVNEEVPATYAEARDNQDASYRVTIAEGATSWQVVEGLRALDLLDGKVKDVPPEGSLAPGSYEVAAGAVRSELLAEMSAAQSLILESAWNDRDPDLPLDSPEEALVLASIIEKETGVSSERGQVASVFINRLRRGMKLQTDPTVIYGITQGQKVLGRGLRQSELRRKTPYNTYVIAGLPPTPIANPGRASIEAALHPEDTPYIFFVADGSGGHVFAETIGEHNANVAKWRKIEAERKADN